MNSNTPETFEEALAKVGCHRKMELSDGVSYYICGDTQLCDNCFFIAQSLRITHTTALEAAKREAREEFAYELNSCVDMPLSESTPTLQEKLAYIAKVVEYELSHPNQPKPESVAVIQLTQDGGSQLSQHTPLKEEPKQ